MKSIVLVAMEDWTSTAQLPEAFAGAGVKVIALCNAGVPLDQNRYLAATVRLSGDIGSDLEQLLAEYDPAALVACDEGAVHGLYPLVDAPALSPRLRDLLRLSFGNPLGHRVVTSKWMTRAVAEQLYIRVPKQNRVSTAEQASAFAKEFGYPIILKQENTYGGKGCYICRSDRETLGNYVALRMPGVVRKLRRFPGFLAALHPFVAHQDSGCEEPFIVQRYHDGQLAFCAAVARDGVMLGCLSVMGEHVHPTPMGPSTVVRAIENPEMVRATEALIRHTGLSGFLGVDFILDRSDGLSYLLEINPRVTPVCRLGWLLGVNLCGLFAANFAGAVLQPVGPRTIDTIAFFPYEWLRSWRSPYLRDAYVDLPHDDPRLLAHIYKKLPVSRQIMLALGLRGTLPSAGGSFS